MNSNYMMINEDMVPECTVTTAHAAKVMAILEELPADQVIRVRDWLKKLQSIDRNNERVLLDFILSTNPEDAKILIDLMDALTEEKRNPDLAKIRQQTKGLTNAIPHAYQATFTEINAFYDLADRDKWEALILIYDIGFLRGASATENGKFSAKKFRRIRAKHKKE